MSNFLHRFYPYQALKLMVQRVRLIAAKSTTPIGPHSPHYHEEPFDPVSARSQLVTLFSALKSSQIALVPTMDHSGSDESTIRRSILQHQLGFHLEIGPSRIQNAGLGVFLRGHRIARPGVIVAMYPGTLYRPGEAILFNSIRNWYILKCNDSVYVDGKAKGLSGWLFRSANARDNYPGITATADTTWMTDWNVLYRRAEESGRVKSSLIGIGTETLKNPLAIGQIVNNGTRSYPPNVRYQELDIRTRDFPLELQEFLPNIWSSGDWHAHDHDDHEAVDDTSVDWSQHSQNDLDYLRTVVLVTTRSVEEGEELYSTYIEHIN
ncbi:MAG: hypothetical protein J3Q66DRAFT_348210 [Benniella sp.]|nr:MAG: hypothetical protein J3Q66DRAFT_348210 [Benniella sp.]